MRQSRPYGQPKKLKIIVKNLRNYFVGYTEKKLKFFMIPHVSNVCTRLGAAQLYIYMVYLNLGTSFEKQIGN